MVLVPLNPYPFILTHTHTHNKIKAAFTIIILYFITAVECVQRAISSSSVYPKAFIFETHYIPVRHLSARHISIALCEVDLYDG